MIQGRVGTVGAALLDTKRMTSIVCVSLDIRGNAARQVRVSLDRLMRCNIHRLNVSQV